MAYNSFRPGLSLLRQGGAASASAFRSGVLSGTVKRGAASSSRILPQQLTPSFPVRPPFDVSRIQAVDTSGIQSVGVRALHSSAAQKAMDLSHLPPAGKDVVFGAQEDFKAALSAGTTYEMNGAKFPPLNLTVGVLQRDGEVVMPPIVKDVLSNTKLGPQNYQAISGHPDLISNSLSFLYGDNVDKSRFASVQTIGGTNALSTGFRIETILKPEVAQKVYLPNATWPAHRAIASKADMVAEDYPYLDKSGKYDHNAFTAFLRDPKTKGSVLLHLSAHNPSGKGLSLDQWREVVSIFKEREADLFLKLDAAYSGLDKGFDADLAPLKMIMAADLPHSIARSSSKNEGAYAIRSGTYHVYLGKPSSESQVGSNADVAKAQFQLNQIQRSTFSNPPFIAGKVSAEVLSPKNIGEWKSQVESHISQPIKDARASVASALDRPELGLSKVQVAKLKELVLDAGGMFILFTGTESQLSSLRDDCGVFGVPSNFVVGDETVLATRLLVPSTPEGCDQLAHALAVVTKMEA